MSFSLSLLLLSGVLVDIVLYTFSIFLGDSSLEELCYLTMVVYAVCGYRGIYRVGILLTK